MKQTEQTTRPFAPNQRIIDYFVSTLDDEMRQGKKPVVEFPPPNPEKSAEPERYFLDQLLDEINKGTELGLDYYDAIKETYVRKVRAGKIKPPKDSGLRRLILTAKYD